MTQTTARLDRLGLFYAFGATLLWSMNFVVARGIADAVPPAALSWWRWVIATLVLLPIAGPLAWRQRQLLYRHWRFIGGCGLLVVALFNLLMYRAAHYAEAFNLSLMAISSPVMMLLLAAATGQQRLTLRHSLGISLTLFGIVLLLTEGELTRLAQVQLGEGELWALAGAATFAVYSLLLRARPPELAQNSFLLGMFAMGTLCLLPAYWWEWQQGAVTYWEPLSVGSVLYLGLGASLLGFYWWNRAVARLGAANAGAIYFSLPLFAGVGAALLLGEPIGHLHWICGGLIISGIGVIQRAQTRS